MDIFSVISLLGGLALFLYGMTIMTNGLERVSGGRLENIMEKMTGNIIKSVGFGALITAAIQSSSATTVIVVGLVNARILKLKNAIGIIMGANIGTTVTAHILRLTDLEGGNMLTQLLKPTTLAPVASIVGILMMMLSKKKTRRDIGSMLLGVSILFTGMFAMEGAVSPLRDSPAFARLFSAFSNPFLGVLVGTLVTAVIQSSAASIGILQALTSTGIVSFSAAFPIIMGQNIGTCITPVLAAIGASKNGKRSALVHVSFNVIGTLLFLAVIYALQYTLGFPFWNDSIDKGGIANFHTLFNVTVTLVLIPFAGYLEKLAYVLIRPTADEVSQSDDATDLLDDRFITSPGYAIAQAREAVVHMANLSFENFGRAMRLLKDFDRKELEKAREVEDVLDKLQSRVDIYLIKITRKDLTEAESMQLSEVLQVVNEYERIGDHADNICDCAQNLNERGTVFSEGAIKELEVVSEAVEEIVKSAVKGYTERNLDLASVVEPLEEVINILVETLKVRHADRLQQGQCNLDSAFPFVEILYNLERIADHCSNVGVHVISYGGSETLDRHEYLREMRRRQSAEYKRKFEMYDHKYYDRIADGL
ncbi:MAG: Na/Pi cotransporter family protein [Oscillospiraceae bacterium]|nr:Na/Pi cotransporter family protein [Oscillospiraceae bacterium]